MKTIYVETDEEITSVIDKLKSTLGEKIVLVVPKEATILQSIVNLRLLKMEAKSLKKTIVLVTADPVGQNLATQLGIMVYESLQSEKPMIMPPRPQPPTAEEIVIDFSKNEIKSMPKDVSVHHFQDIAQSNMSEPKPISSISKSEPKLDKKLKEPTKKSLKLIIILSIIIILAGLSFVFLPYTVITLFVKVDPFEKEILVNLDKNVSEISLDLLTIPATPIEKEMELSKDFQATGKKEVGKKAKGTVSLNNKTGDNQTISAGQKTRSDSGLVFITLSDATIPAASAKVDSSGNVTITPGKIDVGVEASEPGAKYNLAPTHFTILDLPSSKANNIFGQSAQNFSGGTSEQVTVVSEEDIESAKKALTNDSLQALKDEVKKEKGDLQFLDDAIDQNIESYTSSQAAGSQVESFKGTIKTKANALAFNEKDFRKIILDKAKLEVPEGQMLIVSSQDEIITTLKSKDIQAGQMKVSGLIKSKIGAQMDTSKLKQEIIGKKLSSAENILKNQSGVEQVQTKITPSFWLKRTPYIKYDLKIKLEYK